jgi:hypothetical protein
MSRVVWRQFAVALFSIVAFFALMRLRGHQASTNWADLHGGIGHLLLLDLPGWIVMALPLATGVAVALVPLRAGAFPVAIRMLGVVFAVLLVYDLFGVPREGRAYRAAYTPEYAATLPPLRLDDTAGALQRTVAHLRGVVQPGDLTRWPPTRDSSATSGVPAGAFAPITDGAKFVRRDRVMAFQGVLDLASPFLLMGLVLGFGAWVHRIATFRSERDERLLRLVVAWVIVIGVTLFVAMIWRSSMFDISMRGQWMGWVVVPYLLVAIPAFLGWRAVWRLDRLAGE